MPTPLYIFLVSEASCEFKPVFLNSSFWKYYSKLWRKKLRQIRDRIGTLIKSILYLLIGLPFHIQVHLQNEPPFESWVMSTKETTKTFQLFKIKPRKASTRPLATRSYRNFKATRNTSTFFITGCGWVWLLRLRQSWISARSYSNFYLWLTSMIPLHFLLTAVLIRHVGKKE